MCLVLLDVFLQTRLPKTKQKNKKCLHTKESLEAVGITGEVGLALIPSGLAEVDDETMDRNLGAVEALLELEDVDSVEHNMA